LKIAMPSSARDVLTPDAFAMLETVAEAGSLAAAARSLGMVPSALSYRVRQIEDALDVLLFDRSARQVRLTEAGAELLREGTRLLGEIDAVANRVKRVATGWEPQFTVAVDSIVDMATVMELCDAFFAQQPPTRIRLRAETLSGTMDALFHGHADLALGGTVDPSTRSGVHSKPLGTVGFVFAVAPHHPLAQADEPISDELLRQHRAVAVADSVQRGQGITVGLLGGQDVLTVPSMLAKLDAQLRGLGCGFLPQALAEPYVDSGRLVARRVQRPDRQAPVRYAWREPGRGPMGRALQWWLARLDSPTTRAALLGLRQGPGV
jgi:DNA-binding transcriptional LysR family regulator